ncbi:MAG: tRNA uridine-5-carboxymethylaminomethyl(34) synthesis GTPase MnmE [Bacteroidales bacterium]|nr:tRNA uridine-5-carboxymethylaminomethyl(34) synthesis GTPase MnmE [Bacteroidales bacterium]
MSTIAAISTPAGVGGIAVIRLSGPDAFNIATQHLAIHPPQGPQPSTQYARFQCAGQLIDEVMVTSYCAPHSFTGEHTVEISCHGSLYVQQTILESLLASGAIMAQPGEFTQRAFLNGKLDLSQAEAVADLIDSTNEGNHALAISQLRGGYAKQLASLRQQFVELTSLLELELDFSDEDVEFADRQQIYTLIDTILAQCTQLCQSFHLGNAIKHGVPVAIVGRPNVGKSTLLNALVGEERAIVSDIAGTTRDTIEDTITLNGITFRFIDTAGLRHSQDTIESLGIQRSFRAIEQAQVILYLTDQPQSLTQELQQLSCQVSLQGKQLITVITKGLSPAESNPQGTITISAREGTGLDCLCQRLTQAYTTTDRHQPILSNIRHYEALQRVIAALNLVRQGLDQSLPTDLVVIDLREALHHLGSITGQVTTHEILGAIFHRFCIGK